MYSTASLCSRAKLSLSVLTNEISDTIEADLGWLWMSSITDKVLSVVEEVHFDIGSGTRLSLMSWMACKKSSVEAEVKEVVLSGSLLSLVLSVRSRPFWSWVSVSWAAEAPEESRIVASLKKDYNYTRRRRRRKEG